jgi:hypothetical protein
MKNGVWWVLELKLILIYKTKKGVFASGMNEGKRVIQKRTKT